MNRGVCQELCQHSNPFLIVNDRDPILAVQSYSAQARSLHRKNAALLARKARNIKRAFEVPSSFSPMHLSFRSFSCSFLAIHRSIAVGTMMQCAASGYS